MSCKTTKCILAPISELSLTQLGSSSEVHGLSFVTTDPCAEAHRGGWLRGALGWDLAAEAPGWAARAWSCFTRGVSTRTSPASVPGTLNTLGRRPAALVLFAELPNLIPALSNQS